MAKDKKVKQKPKKMSKSAATEKVYQSFNTLDYKTLTYDILIDGLYVNAANILADHGLSVNVWVTFANLEIQVKKTWDTQESFIRFWLDRVVEEFGFMLWNEMYRKYFNEDWHKHGILHDIPELPKKLRSNPEAVATHFADMVVSTFKKHYI